MKKLKQFSRVLLSLIAMSLLWGGQADAASAKAVLKDHFVQMSPVRITNYLKDHHGSNILIPYIQVKSKTAAKTLCAWMPRVRDAFVMAVRSPLKHVSYQKNRQKLDISVVLKQAADRVVPAQLVTGVLAFNPHDPKDHRAARKLKAKLNCNNLK
jgi:hypothetical protein